MSNMSRLTAATHHFRLDPTGGAIEVVANDLTDEALRQRIRTHLESIAKAFATGDFGKPLATHAELPPGTRTMTQYQIREHKTDDTMK